MNCLPPRTVGTTITESFRNTGWPPLRNILSKPSYINQGENGGSQIIKTSTLICNFFSYIFYCILFDFPLLILLLLADNPQSSSSSSSSSSSASSSTSASSGWFLPHPPLLLFLWKRGENVSCIFSSPFNISPTSFPPPYPLPLFLRAWNNFRRRRRRRRRGGERRGRISFGINLKSFKSPAERSAGWNPALQSNHSRMAGLWNRRRMTLIASVRWSEASHAHRNTSPASSPLQFYIKINRLIGCWIEFLSCRFGGGREGASWGERRRERGLLFTFSSL